MIHDITIHEDLASLSAAVARQIADLANQAIKARGTFHLALAGGSTPRHCYESLRTLSLDWTKIQLYFGDERCLPVGDAERNDSMAYATLINHIAIPSENIHCIPAELGAEDAAAQYRLVIEKLDKLDLILLGLGEDGHTASLFPDNPATESRASVVAVFNSPKPPPERVSLGLTTINAARHKIFLIAGKSKREPLARIRQGELLPAARVIGAKWHVGSEDRG
jgi:6-phosphogluconolactonase